MVHASDLEIYFFPFQYTTDYAFKVAVSLSISVLLDVS